jgi:hypothetical protein
LALLLLDIELEARASAKVDVIATTKDEKSFHLPRESLLLAYRASSSLNVRLLGSCGLFYREPRWLLFVNSLNDCRHANCSGLECRKKQGVHVTMEILTNWIEKILPIVLVISLVREKK